MSAILEPFLNFPEAFIAGLITAAVCSFLGVFVVLKRTVFIGTVLSEAAACGIAAALFFNAAPYPMAFAFSLAAVGLLAAAPEDLRVPKDALLALLFTGLGGLAVLFVSKSAAGLEEVKSLLFGDMILATRMDLILLCTTAAPSAFAVFFFSRPVVYVFADREAARVLGLRTRFWEFFFYFMLAAAVAAASKTAGMLLVFCYLAVPPVIGLLFGRRMRQVFLITILTALFFCSAGFMLAYAFDLPVNPAIAALALVICLPTLLLRRT